MSCRSFSSSFTVKLFLAVSLAACGGRTVTLSVLRPATVSVRQHGGTVTIAAFASAHPMFVSQAMAVQQELRQRILAAEVPVAQLLEAGGAVVIHGSVNDASYSEQIMTNPQTCSRSVNGRSYSYTCMQYQRIGTAHVSISFNISTTAGQPIFARTFDDSTQMSTVAVDQTPGFIDGNGLIDNLRATGTAAFARVIVPWRDTVVIEPASCRDPIAQLCTESIDHMEDGDYAGAVTGFEQALAQLDTVRDVTPEQRAAVFYNMALALEYAGEYDRAAAALSQAIAGAPNEERYRAEFESVERMRTEAAALRSQGVEQVSTVPPTSGGGPAVAPSNATPEPITPTPQPTRAQRARRGR